MLKFQLKSGKMVELNLAPMDNALYLYRTIIHECKGAGLDITAVDGESPVYASLTKPSGILSSAEHEKFCVNQRGPSRKAKYSRETDSEPVL